jgi:hypothetical protein
VSLTIALTWDVVSGATGYQVYYAKQSFSGISLSNYASLNGGSLLQNHHFFSMLHFERLTHYLCYRV